MDRKLPYYYNFPDAPQGILDLLIDIPPGRVLCAKVGADNSVFLDIEQDENFRISAEDLTLIRRQLGTCQADMFVEPSLLSPTALSITCASTWFGFADLFRGTPWELSIDDARKPNGSRI